MGVRKHKIRSQGVGVMQPCSQGERLVKLETILLQNVAMLDEQKQLSKKTYDILSSISLQGEQIKVLINDVAKLKIDVEEAFKDIRHINKRHDQEFGAEQAIKEEHKTLEKVAVPVLMTFCFFVWVGDKFN